MKFSFRYTIFALGLTFIVCCNAKNSLEKPETISKTQSGKILLGKDSILVFYEMDDQKKISSKQKQIVDRIIKINNQLDDSAKTALFNYYKKNRNKLIQVYGHNKLLKEFPEPTSPDVLTGKYKLYGIKIPPDSKFQGIHIYLGYNFIWDNNAYYTVEMENWKILSLSTEAFTFDLR